MPAPHDFLYLNAAFGTHLSALPELEIQQATAHLPAGGEGSPTWRTLIYSSSVPRQSLHAKYPGLTIAATELGVHRGHLHRVVRGERQSKRLLDRWHAWLRDHPEFAALYRKSA